MSMPGYDPTGGGRASAGGGGAGGATTPGILPGFRDEGALSVARDDPKAALAYFQMQNGGADKSGAWGKYRDSMMARALQAYLSIVGLGGAGGGQTTLNASNQGAGDFMKQYQGGQGVGGFLQGAANQVLNGGPNGARGVDFTNMNSDQIMNILNTVTGMTQFGAPEMATYGTSNALDDLEAQKARQFFSGGGKTSVLSAPGGGADTFRKLLQTYLATK